MRKDGSVCRKVGLVVNALKWDKTIHEEKVKCRRFNIANC